MSYQLIHQLQKEAIPVKHSCRVLAVSRSGYYEAQRRSAKPSACKASVHLKAAFLTSQQGYCSRRLVTVRAAAGQACGEGLQDHGIDARTGLLSPDPLRQGQ
jgi:putative transposase